MLFRFIIVVVSFVIIELLVAVSSYAEEWKTYVILVVLPLTIPPQMEKLTLQISMGYIHIHTRFLDLFN
ncbi:hypothetical protein BH23THE1_BH23THE1_25720 [soil metagenome]